MNRIFFHTLPAEPPPWWPEGEPWPPERPLDSQQLKRLRRKFMWGVAALFLLLVVTILIFSAALNWIYLSLSGQRWPIRGPIILVRLIGPVLIFSSLGSLFWVGVWLRRMALPIGDLLVAARKVSKHDYSVRVPERGPRSMRDLAAAFNSMAEHLQANDEHRRGLLADVSHELRTPLTIIQGNLEGMLDGIYPAEPETIQTVLEETHTLSRMIDDLRTLSLAEGDMLALRMETTDLGELVQDTAEAFTAQCAAQAVTLEVETGADLPLVRVDPTRIREVISNLVINALRYTPAGGTIRVRCTRSPEKQPEVRIEISDTGVGIDPAELPFIFERFYKSSESGGSGLGLAISRELVRVHHGQISAQSTPGTGTTLTIQLPAA